MLTMFCRAALIGLFAFAVALVAFAIMRSSSEPQNQAYNQAASQSSNSEPRHDELPETFRERLALVWRRTWTDPVAFYTFVLAIFTGLLAIVAATQIWLLIRAEHVATISANA